MGSSFSLKRKDLQIPSLDTVPAWSEPTGGRGEEAHGVEHLRVLCALSLAWLFQTGPQAARDPPRPPKRLLKNGLPWN